jgi:prophage regulatory protein
MTKILKLPDVMEATALSRSSIYAFIQKGIFPRPCRLGERAVGWKSDEISAWIESRTAGGDHAS